MVALAVIAAASLAGWLGVLFGTSRAWDLHPIAEDEPSPPDPADWPSVAVLVPALNEANLLPETLPALLAQDYPGAWHLLLVDDRSTDGTVEVARGFGARHVPGTDLPDGWVGKVWALEQGRQAAGEPDYYLLTDADIRHTPVSLRRLVAESDACGLALNSRMARLHCESTAERLLIPPFLYFFNLLYPMRRVNRRPATAGGCMLVRRDALDRAGGLASIADRVIDDVSLARALAPHGRLRLAVSRADVVSVRWHDFGGIWRMVRRTAFTQLHRSWALLVLTVALLALLFVAPPTLTLVAAARGDWLMLALAASAWTLLSALYLPTVRYFDLSPAWTLTLPFAGLLYGAMTIDSAVRDRRGAW